jgi:copper oxidase (laccase) domain-containing protein
VLTLLRRRVGGRTVEVVATDRTDGDVHPRRNDAGVLRRRQVATSGRSWVMLDQVHGVGVHRAGVGDECVATVAVGDVVVLDDDELHGAVWAADCAPVWLLADTGRRVGFHAGWRGLVAGVVDVAVDALEAPVAAAVLGPCIHPCCYEFGADELAAVAAAVGVPSPALAATTTSGSPALDVPAAIEAALGRHGIGLDVVGPCTGCDRRWFSHRVRAEPGRHAVVTSVPGALVVA